MNKLKKILYNAARQYLKKQFTNNLGKVVEDDEKITCYVKKSKIKNNKYNCSIACFGIKEEEKDIAKAYNLNKPICYVIDGIELKKYNTYIFGYDNCEVIVNNCNFGFGLSISVHGKCTLSNTNIRTFSHLSIGANELIIKDMESNQINVVGSEYRFLFGADDKMEIVNSNIGNQEKNIKISMLATNELNVINSNIVGKEIECKSVTINTDEKSSLIATDNVNLQTNNCNPINISAPEIVFNGEKIENEKNSILLKKMNEPLTQKRFELVNILKKLKSQCENINSEKVLEYQEKLNVQPVSKVLKK